MHFKKEKCRFFNQLKSRWLWFNLTGRLILLFTQIRGGTLPLKTATDRAYRIGQDKPVFVYKLVAENTVEERIARLQQKALADALFSSTSKASKIEDKEDLLALLRL